MSRVLLCGLRALSVKIRSSRVSESTRGGASCCQRQLARLATASYASAGLGRGVTTRRYSAGRVSKLLCG